MKIMRAEEKKEIDIVAAKRKAPKKMVVVVAALGWMGRCRGWVHRLRSSSICWVAEYIKCLPQHNNKLNEKSMQVLVKSS